MSTKTKTIDAFCKEKAVSPELTEAFKIYVVDAIKNQLKLSGSKETLRTKLSEIPVHSIEKYFISFMNKLKFEIDILERD